MRHPETIVNVKQRSQPKLDPRQMMDEMKKCSENYKSLPCQYDDDAIQIETPLGTLPLPEWTNNSSEYKHGEPYQGDLTHLFFPRFTVHWTFSWNEDCGEHEAPFSFEIAAPLPLDRESRCIVDDLEEARRWLEKVETELHAWIAIPAKEITAKEKALLGIGEMQL